MDDSAMLLPDGRRFEEWTDTTRYRKVYHVAAGSAGCGDANPGTAKAPWATIGRAAAVLRPCEKVIIHRGIYRERVCPAHGGTGSDQMIAYEAAPGEQVVLRGSVLWHPGATPSRGWNLGGGASASRVWMADLPREALAGYNPFLIRNVYEHLYCFGSLKDPDWVRRALRRRGMVFHEGQPLRQVFFPWDLAETDGTFWVEEPGLRIHCRLPGDADPADTELEITAREQVFAPDEFGLGFIRVSGLTIEHAADGWPIPQRAALSTTRGHHWIIENNRIRWVNGCGMDIGLQSWNATPQDPCGHHGIRNNHISDCGICGIAGSRGVEHTLIEGNIIERIGFHDVERLFECAAIKFHFARHSLLRRNVIRHIAHAGGVWLDVDNVNNRISGNVFADIATMTGACYSEMNFETNLIDHNLFWDIRSEDLPAGGPPPVWGGAVRADCNESLIVAHNFFGKVQAHAVAFSLFQAERQGGDGRTGLCRANVAINNVFFQCPHRIHLGRREINQCDGNLFDRRNRAGSFELAYPVPSARQNLDGWQRYLGLDRHSTEGTIDADFDAERLSLTWRQTDGNRPQCQRLGLPVATRVPGPGRALLEGLPPRPAIPASRRKAKRIP